MLLVGMKNLLLNFKKILLGAGAIFAMVLGANHSYDCSSNEVIQLYTIISGLFGFICSFSISFAFILILIYFERISPYPQTKMYIFFAAKLFSTFRSFFLWFTLGVGIFLPFSFTSGSLECFLFCCLILAGWNLASLKKPLKLTEIPREVRRK